VRFMKSCSVVTVAEAPSREARSAVKTAFVEGIHLLLHLDLPLCHQMDLGKRSGWGPGFNSASSQVCRSYSKTAGLTSTGLSKSLQKIKG